MWIISIVSLSIIVALCVLGVYHAAFKDNLLQCVGMGFLCIALAGRIERIWGSEYIDFGEAAVHISLAFYAVGTALKVIVHHGRDRRWWLVLNVDRWLFKRQTAAGFFDDKPHHHQGRS